MNGGIRITGSAQAPLAECSKFLVDVVGLDDDRLTILAVPAMAREEEAISAACQHAERGIIQALVPIHALEIEDAGIELERSAHVSAADRRNDRHDGIPLNADRVCEGQSVTKRILHGHVPRAPRHLFDAWPPV